MSTVQEIESAIGKLGPAERDHLVRDLPRLLPELDGDAAWERINNDPRPRPALATLLDKVDAEMQRNPEAFPEIQDRDFGQK